MSAPAGEPRIAARALLFDFGGTLDAEGVAWKDRFYRLAADEGLDAPREVFDRAFYAATDVLEGCIPASTGLPELVERIADGLASGLERDSGLLRRIGTRFLHDSQAQLAESAALLSDLNGRFRIGIVSNFYGNLQTVCAEAGLFPAAAVAVDSTIAGFKKPDPRIFQAALDALQVSAAEAVFVGDSLRRDMAGAAGMGMRHIWLRPASAAGDGPCCPGDATIERREDILRLEL